MDRLVEDDTRTLEHGTPWRLSYFPYIAGMANDGPGYFLRARYWQPAEYEARTTYTAAVDGAVGTTFEGSRLAVLRFRAPGLKRTPSRLTLDVLCISGKPEPKPFRLTNLQLPRPAK